MFSFIQRPVTSVCQLRNYESKSQVCHGANFDGNLLSAAAWELYVNTTHAVSLLINWGDKQPICLKSH